MISSYNVYKMARHTLHITSDKFYIENNEFQNEILVIDRVNEEIKIEGKLIKI